MAKARFKDGDHVETPHGRAVVVDTYWAHRDRYSVKFPHRNETLDYSGDSLRWIDPDDAPELTDEWFDKAQIKRGGQPVKPAVVQTLAATLRVDGPRLAALAAGYRTCGERVDAHNYDTAARLAARLAEMLETM